MLYIILLKSKRVFIQYLKFYKDRIARFCIEVFQSFINEFIKIFQIIEIVC